ncbi:MAG: hypothetical protein IJZ88_00805 [Clostridia bacterium]|nr:hypothetical protein [Clostridia bacterium]
MLLLIICSESAVYGAKIALEICASTVIPSLFPFMAVSSYMIKSGCLAFLGNKCKKVSRFLFDLPGQAGVIFLMSTVGGFPVGSKLVSDCVKNGSLTQNQGKRMLLFCVNPGPAFVINVVGYFMLGSKRAGVILLIGLCAASFLTGVVSRFFKDKSDVKADFEINRDSSPLVNAVSESIAAILSICGWIVMLSVLLNMINVSSLPINLKHWVTMLAEVTGGCRVAVDSFPLPFVAFVLGWAGVAVHGQVFAYISSVGLKYRYFAVSRVFNATLSMGISYILFKLFPCQVAVFSNAGEILPRGVSVSVPATIGMLFLSALVILDLAPKRKV